MSARDDIFEGPIADSSDVVGGGSAVAQDPAPEGSSGTESKEVGVEDQLLRLRAEFDNYRKRMQRERDEDRTRALARQAAAVLPVLDALERAVQTPATGEAIPYQEGVERIRVQMAGILEELGLTEVPGVGVEFDPSLHEALATDVESDQPAGIVLEVLQKGYRLGDHLIRPARVRVSKGMA